MSSETVNPEPSPILKGTCYGGPCDGQTFDHTSDMKRVRIRDRGKPPQAHIYQHHEELSLQQAKPIFVYEKIEAWKVS